MLAVAAQLPAAVVADASRDVTGRAPPPGAPDPEASGEAASVRTAQLADATNLMRMTNPLFSPR
jgi:hypothetical protein